MFCDKCGAEIKKQHQFCAGCGKKVDAPIDVGGIKKLTSKKIQNRMSSIKEQTESFQESRKEDLSQGDITKAEDLFFDPNEQQIAVLGMGYLSNFIRGQMSTKGFAILSNKRLYFRGSCFRRSGNQYIKSREERSVDLQDITSSGFVYYHNVLLLVVSIIWSCMVFWSNTVMWGYMNFPFFLISIIILVILWVRYFLSRRCIYEVYFAGGMFAIRASKYGIKDTHNFDKMLHIEKDRH